MDRILLVALPCLFLFGVILSMVLESVAPVSALEEKMADIDRPSSFCAAPAPCRWSAHPARVKSSGDPAFHVEPSRRELQVTVKLENHNLLIIGISF